MKNKELFKNYPDRDFMSAEGLKSLLSPACRRCAILGLMLLLAVSGIAQVPPPSCYEPTRNEGIAAYNKGEYDKAITYFYLALNTCPDMPNNNDLQAYIDKCIAAKGKKADNDAERKKQREAKKKQKAEKTTLISDKGVVINGITWATRNVDAPGTFTKNPEDAGMFYQWNRKIGWSSASPMVNSDGGTTWDETHIDGSTWEKANDPCPSGWRVPTWFEFERLLNFGSGWITKNGVNGRIFGFDSNTLFLPAAGWNSNSNNDNLSGNYWSATPYGSTNFTWGLTFSSFLRIGVFYGFRNGGHLVRCVADSSPSCYEPTRGKGKDAYKKGEYDKAMMYFNLANTCPDKPSNNDLQSYLNKCKDAKEKAEAKQQMQDKAEQLALRVGGIAINGVVWAKSNVDAPGTFVKNPGDDGMLYQWNGKKGWYSTGDVSGWDSITPSSTIWEKVNDPCPAGWRVPTRFEIESLASSGREIIKNGFSRLAFGSGSNTVLLPSVGYRAGNNGTSYGLGDFSYYWSATPDSLERAWGLFFFYYPDGGTNGRSYTRSLHRNCGFPIRCVAEDDTPNNNAEQKRQWEAEVQKRIEAEANRKYEAEARRQMQEKAEQLALRVGGVAINGVTWATRNVDAPGTFAKNPEDAGMFYQWNGKRGWASTGDVSGWDSSIPIGTTLEEANDPCPPGWRVPTMVEMEILLSSGSQWKTQNGVDGRVFGSGLNTVFLPAANNRLNDGNLDGSLNRINSKGGFYWSATPNGSNFAWGMLFGGGRRANMLFGYRGNGYSVRCVAEDDTPNEDVKQKQQREAETQKQKEAEQQRQREATQKQKHAEQLAARIGGVAINGVVWAKSNVDAPGTFAKNPEDGGMFYQWNRKKDWTSTGDVSGWDSSIPIGATLEKANDPCPSGWRVPTMAEFESLLDSGSRWTTLNGVNGRVFGSRSNTVFLPADGRLVHGDGSLSNQGDRGDYWSATPHGLLNAWYLTFDGSYAGAGGYYCRNFGFSIRCVAE
ncbi:MAG: hypothetical protein LBS52_10025 [Dysgonamonadaceae bacterium]|jgi:uncharacterized protein (TIGR02145 family)|nr:hypothetical protein [Dysgonamonadaceae bacterium]